MHFRHPKVHNPRGILSKKQDSLLRCANKFRSMLQLSHIGGTGYTNRAHNEYGLGRCTAYGTYKLTVLEAKTSIHLHQGTEILMQTGGSIPKKKKPFSSPPDFVMHHCTG